MKPLIAIVVLQVTASVLALPKEMAKRDVDSGFGLGWNDKWMIIRGDGSTSDDERAGFMNVVRSDVDSTPATAGADDIDVANCDVDRTSATECIVDKRELDMGAHVDWDGKLDIKRKV